MADTGFNWFYLIIILIPLSRVLPRLIKKWRMKKSGITQKPMNSQFQVSGNAPESRGTRRVQWESKSTDMLV